MKPLFTFALLTSLAFAQAAPHSVTLTWTPGTGGTLPTGFNVKRAAIAGGPYLTIASPVAATFVDPFQFTDEGKKFFYVVSATGPGGESPNSAEVPATIPFSVPATPSTPTATVK
jgi:hypothetical protein